MLPKQERLKKSSEFSSVYNQKKSVANSLLILYVGKKKQSEELTKVGFVVAKKISKKSNKRNKIKRLMREAYKKAKSSTAIQEVPWNRIIFLARPNILEVEFKEVYDNIVDCLKKADKKYGYSDLSKKSN